MYRIVFDITLISKELQLGKVGEYLVCADLIASGYNAFLADQGSPFDIIVVTGSGIKRIQVRSTYGLKDYTITKNVYRFRLRTGRESKEVARKCEVDYYAFVSISNQKIAYINVNDLTNVKNDNCIKTLQELRDRNIEYSMNRGSKYIDDYKFEEPKLFESLNININKRIEYIKDEHNKKCSLCLEVKPLSEFYSGRKNHDGYSGRCKICNRQKVKEWKQKNNVK